MKDNILKLNPFFALFSPVRFLMVLVYSALFAFLIFYDTAVNIPMIILAVIFIVFSYIRLTRKIYIERGSMEFIYYHRVRGFRKYRYVKTLYTVTDIEYLKFEQNFVEKLFGAGHFSIICRSNIDASKEYYYKIEPKKSFTFYGLTNFRQTKKEICDILGVNESE